MQLRDKFLVWMDRATLLRMDYRSHCAHCGVTIAAPCRQELARLVYEHEAQHPPPLPLFTAHGEVIEP